MGSIFFGGLQCFCHSFVYVVHFVFLGVVWIRTQRAAAASRGATNLATHLPGFNPTIYEIWGVQKRQRYIKFKNQTEVHGIMKWNCSTSFWISTFMYLEAFYIFPQSVLFGIFISCIAWDNSQLNRRNGEKGRELPPSSSWRQYPALPSAPAVEPRAHKKMTNIQISNLENYG